jgi:hypothetical protein
MKSEDLMRFAYIETQLYWGDGFTARDLANYFGLSRQRAQAIIEAYRKKHTGQMCYDNSLKRQIATVDFTPYYIDSRTIQFLDYLRGQNLREHYLEEEGWSELIIKDADWYLRPKLSRQIVQPILGALRHQKTLFIEYQPITITDEQRSHLISPNHLVFAHNRYHLLAYSHTLNRYADFVLSRILLVEPADEDWVSAEDSEEWRTVTLRYQPNPKLPKEIQKILLRGYPGSEKGIWEIQCPKNLAFYIQKKIGRDFDKGRKMSLWIEIKE